MRKILVALAFSTLLSVGCSGTLGGQIQRGIDRYNRSDYHGAVLELAEVSEKVESLNGKGATRYLVYRGLAHYHLGQRELAYTFLHQGKVIYSRGEPHWLPPGIVVEMDQALAALASPPLAHPPPPAPAQTTIIVVPGGAMR